MRHREREHRAERVDRAQEVGLARQHGDAGERREDEDADVRRPEVRVQPPQAVRHLAVDAHRVGQARDAEDAGVRRRDEDRHGEEGDVRLAGPLRAGRGPCLRRCRGSGRTRSRRPPRRRRAASCSSPRFGVAGHRQRRQRDPREREVDREHGDHHALDRGRDRLRLVARLARHVRDRLDAGVGDGADRDRDQEVASRSGARRAQVLDQDLRAEDQEHAGDDERELADEVDHREHDVDADRVLHATHVHAASARSGGREDDVARRGAQSAPRPPAE